MIAPAIDAAEVGLRELAETHGQMLGVPPQTEIAIVDGSLPMIAGANLEMEGSAPLDGVRGEDEGGAEAVAERLVGEPQTEDANKRAVAAGVEVGLASEVVDDSFHDGTRVESFYTNVNSDLKDQPGLIRVRSISSPRDWCR